MASHTRASENVTCPLCLGHGNLQRELLITRSRDPEFRDLLIRYWDDSVASDEGGLENPFESREESSAGSTRALHGSGTGIPKE